MSERSITLQYKKNPLYDKLPVRLQVDAEGEILFNANDVCEALELSNPWQAIASHVEEDDLQKMEVIDSLGRIQQAIMAIMACAPA